MKILHFISSSVVGTVAAFVGFFAYAATIGDDSVVTGYFEGGTVPGKFQYRDSEDGARLLINYYSPSLNKTLTYSVGKFDECSVMAMYGIPNSNQIVVDGSCFSRGGQIYEYIYEWNSRKENWCLIREITGERPDPALGRIAPSERVSRVKGCPVLGMVGPYSYESRVETTKNIAVELKKFRNSSGERKILIEYLNSIRSYDAAELVGYIDPGNVEDVNDLAFYLSEDGRSLDAIPLLEKIVEMFPGRVVAKLNLADAYWDRDFEKKAATLYGEYYREMSAINLKQQIPSRVFVRMK